MTFCDDLIAGSSGDFPPGYFDRFVFNLHPTDTTTPAVLMGHGVYPGEDTVDGFAILITETEQRNLRWSTEFGASGADGAGPFGFEVTNPNSTWQLRLGANPTGVTFDVTWTARAPYWAGLLEVGDNTSFEHLFQSGRYSGVLVIDGHPQRVDGWYGQRDRSRGLRRLSGGQGLHIWFQAQFPDRSLGFLMVESRSGLRVLLEGAAMHENGILDCVTEVRHDLQVDNDLDVKRGRFHVRTESGTDYEIVVDATSAGGYMSGGGYGGQHGQPMGRDHLESDVYAFDGSVNQRTLSTSLTDRLTLFDWDGVEGIGVLEFALSRSSSYGYRPTWT
jgi:hypothetical protein